MKQYSIPTILMLGFGILVRSAGAQPSELAIGADAQEDLMITVYNNNYGLVREVRKITLPLGEVELEFQDVAEKIDPTSVAFKSLTSPGEVSILEQNYRYDLLNPQTLIDKFIGRTIRYTTLRLEGNTEIEVVREGTLLSTNAGTIVRFGDDIVINPPGSVTLSEVPEELLSKPTLVWLLRNSASGEQRIETAYLTNGMNWKADYVAVLSSEETELDLTGWVTLDNRSGTTYRNAALKLVAGDVQRVQEGVRLRRQVRAMAVDAVSERQFAEQAFFEYHLYTLSRRTTLANNETKQMQLLEGLGVPVKKAYVLESPPSAPAAQARGVQTRRLSVMIEFENSEDDNLGMPLPRGRVRVYKADADGSQQLVGEDLIDHTPKDEMIRLKLGEAFDIVAERSQTDYRRLADRVVELSYRVVIRNHKEESITATVIEHVFGDWEIIRSSHPAYHRDSRTAEFTIPVPADDEATLTYTARVTY